VNYQSRFRPELVDDVAEGFHWYEERADGLGQRFLRQYYDAVVAVERIPEIYFRALGDFRRALLRNFPYALYFRCDGDMIVFVLLFPCVRNPRLLRRKLRARRE